MTTYVHDDDATSSAELTYRAAFNYIAALQPRTATTGIDQTDEIQAALDAGGTIVLGEGSFFVTALTISEHRVSLFGQGAGTIIWQTPIGDGVPLFTLVRGSSTINRITMVDFRMASTDTTHQKIAIRGVDISSCHFVRLEIGPVGRWVGNGSIGMQLYGRDTTSVIDSLIASDLPVELNENPNHETLDFDHFNFLNCYLLATDDTLPVIWQREGVCVTNSSFTNTAAINGSHGYYHLSTTTPASTNGPIEFNNFRWEQGSGGGYTIFYSPNATTRNISIRSSNSGAFATVAGYYFRFTHGITIANTRFTGDAIPALNCDGASVDMVKLDNCWFADGTTMSMTNMTRVGGMGDPDGLTEPNYADDFWVSNSNPQLNTAVFFNTLFTAGNVGIGTTPSVTVGALLELLSTGNWATTPTVTNADAASVSSQAGWRAVASTARAALRSYGAAFSGTGFGFSLASWSSVFQSAGSGLALGTTNAAPVKIGANNIVGISLDATHPHPSFPISHKRVTAQRDTTSTALAAIDGMTVDLKAGKTYEFRAELSTTSNVAGGVKFAINGTATATAIIYRARVWNAGTATAIGTARATALGTAVGDVTAVTVADAEISGTITVNVAGTLTVEFAANAATGTTSVLVGSTLDVKELAA